MLFYTQIETAIRGTPSPSPLKGFCAEDALTSNSSVRYVVKSKKTLKAKHSNAWPSLFIVTNATIHEQYMTRRTKTTGREYPHISDTINL